MTNDFVVSLCKTISVFCNRFVSLLYFFSQVDLDAHAFIAPASRRIIGYQCKNPNSGKVFTIVFAYEQDRIHATSAGTLCVSIMMCEELTGVHRADRSTAALISRPHSGFDGATWAQSLEHVDVPT
jgi:hypothetical protein